MDSKLVIAVYKKCGKSIFEKMKGENKNELELPIYTDNYFVKKAEVELDKRLNKRIKEE